jgi:hypothetical protein
MELLGVNRWDHFVSGEKYTPIQFLVYEESDLVIDSRQYLGINTTRYGHDPTAHGHGNRFTAVLPILKQMDPEALVVLSSDRDARVNFPVGNHDRSFRLLYEFRKKFESLTENLPGSIVASTDSDCCTSALTHAKPGDFLSAESKRSIRACMSGESDCEWGGDEKARPWMTFMQELASKRSDVLTNVYLDSSLLVGKASALANIIEVIDIQKLEDDRAVLTDFMYRNPNLLVLDYEQQLLGESRKMPKDPLKKQCFVDSGVTMSRLRYLDFVSTDKQPLFMYSPRDLGCGDTEKNLAPSYPLWDKNGIVLKPILDHINRVVERKASIVLPKEYGFTGEYGQGPEVPYFMDDNGVWSSNLIRDRTNNETMYWRMLPTEKLVTISHELLMREGAKSGRWDRLRETMRSGGFPFWSWYVLFHHL